MNESIIRKIEHLMAISKSSNANEAGIALRQMQAMMAKYNLTASQIELAKINEEAHEVDTKKAPPNWTIVLARMVAEVFDCEIMLLTTPKQYARLNFIGSDASAKIACYTFSILYRTLRTHRENFIDTLKGVERTEKTKRGDAFCMGWVDTVRQKCIDIAPNSDAKSRVKRYMDEKYKNATTASTTNRFTMDTASLRAIREGREKAKSVQIHQGVSADAQSKVTQQLQIGAIV